MKFHYCLFKILKNQNVADGQTNGQTDVRILLWHLLVCLIFKVTEGYPCVTYVYFCVFFFYFCVLCLCVFSLCVFCFLHRQGLCVSVLVWLKYWPIRILCTSVSKKIHPISMLDFWLSLDIIFNSAWTHSGHFWTFVGHTVSKFLLHLFSPDSSGWSTRPFYTNLLVCLDTHEKKDM